MKKKNFILLTTFLGLFAIAKAQYATSWDYQNEKYNYQITLPDSFSGMAESESGDGQIFVSDDNEAHISVYGGFNSNVIFASDVTSEYNETIERLTKNEFQIKEQRIDLTAHDNIDAQYYISGLQYQLCTYQHTIWYGDYSATVIFTFYPSDKTTYEPFLELVMNSLKPSFAIPESMELNELWNNRLTLDISPLLNNPNIADFILVFTDYFQKPLTDIVKTKIENPAYQDEDIDEWICDPKNGYLLCRLVSDSDYWMEACYWRMSNGHKLLAINYNAPTQILVFFDFNPETHRCTPATQEIEPIKELMGQFYVRLPRKGKSITLYPFDDLSKPAMSYTWNGTEFTKE